MPYKQGEKFLVTQAYNTTFTHKSGGKDAFALDFALNGCEIYGKEVLSVYKGNVLKVNNIEEYYSDYGNYVDLMHNGIVSRYAHLESFVVKKGQDIKQGQLIGYVGDTGFVKGQACPEHPGAHLHFAMYQQQGDKLVAYKPEPMSGYTDFQAGNWYTSDNELYEEENIENLESKDAGEQENQNQDQNQDENQPISWWSKISNFFKNLWGDVETFFTDLDIDFSPEEEYPQDENSEVDSSESDQAQDQLGQETDDEDVEIVGDYNYELISQGDQDLILQSEQMTEVKLEIKNIGQQVWQQDLISLNLDLYKSSDASLFYNSTWLTFLRPTKLDQNEIASGQIGSFTFQIQAPENLTQQTQNYTLYFRPVYQAGGGFYWLGSDINLHWNVAVEPEVEEVDEESEDALIDEENLTQDQEQNQDLNNDQAQQDEQEQDEPEEENQDVAGDEEEYNNQNEEESQSEDDQDQEQDGENQDQNNDQNPYYPRRGDSIEPETRILTYPANPTELTQAEFTFEANETAGFECSLDGANFDECFSPQIFTDLVAGQHIFKVRATDSSGNQEDPAQEYIWEIIQPEPEIAINEIAWMGTPADANDEWIELYNPNIEPIDLTGWTLTAVDGTPTIDLEGYILGYEYFILERMDETTLKNISADQIYTGVLSNTGENLELKDADGNLIDSVDCSGGWFAGDNDTKASMERVDFRAAGSQAGNWLSNDGELETGKDLNNQVFSATPKYVNTAHGLQDSATLTTLPAQISVDTTLTLAESPYFVSGYNGLRIDSGAILTIEPGVVVKFNTPGRGSACDASEVKIYGQLIARGTPEAPIVFTSAFDPDYYPLNQWSSFCSKQSWGGIDVYGQADFENVIFKYGQAFTSATGFLKVNDPARISLLSTKLGAVSGTQIYLKTSATIDLENNQIVGQIDSSTGIKIDDPTILNLTGNNLKYLSTTIDIRGEAVVEAKNNLFSHNNKPLYKTVSSTLNLENNTYEENTNNVVWLAGSDDDLWMTNQQTWSDELPYYLFNGLGIRSGAELTLLPGVIIKFGPRKYECMLGSCGCNPAQLIANGKLIAQGTSDQPIIFTSFDDTDYAGEVDTVANSHCASNSHWGQMKISAGQGSILENAVIKNGGNTSATFFSSSGSAALEIKNESSLLNISHISFINNENPLYLYGNGDLNLDSCVFENNDKPIHIENSVGKVVNNQFVNNPQAMTIHNNSGLDISNNTSDQPAIINYLTNFTSHGDPEPSQIVAPTHWGFNTNMVYLIKGHLDVHDKLTIDPGVVVKLTNSGSRKGSIYVLEDEILGNGQILAQGAVGNEIVFTSYYDDEYGGDTNGDADATLPNPANWGSLYSYTDGNIFDYVKVRYGGNADGRNNSRSLITAYNSTPQISNSLIENSDIYGIKASGDALNQMIIQNNTIQNNEYGIYLGSTIPEVIINQNNIVNNTSYGVYNRSGKLVNAQENWWGDTTGPRHDSNSEGLGDKVSDNVDFSNWLTEEL
ncbi:MAG: peptidoglycan DD-metalloendopeptidase family protein [Patescibacteria group bacterium]|nr:peptidoglycan DD-metalloendopeptidase family protein [Patescibacteria group bacterium]